VFKGSVAALVNGTPDDQTVDALSVYEVQPPLEESDAEYRRRTAMQLAVNSTLTLGVLYVANRLLDGGSPRGGAA
jgi:hypothetical protein